MHLISYLGRVEVRRRGNRLHEMAVRVAQTNRVSDEHAARLFVVKHDVVLGVSRRVHDIEISTAAQRDPITLIEDQSFAPPGSATIGPHVDVSHSSPKTPTADDHKRSGEIRWRTPD